MVSWLLSRREERGCAVELRFRREVQGTATRGERGAGSEPIGAQSEKRCARLQEGDVDGDHAGRGYGGARHLEECAARLDRLLHAHDQAAQRIERGGGARDVKDRSRGRDLMRPARDGDEGRRRSRLDDAAPSRAEDEIVR
jgi:hypothetical protein